jgi:hypothetical protein
MLLLFVSQVLSRRLGQKLIGYFCEVPSKYWDFLLSFKGSLYNDCWSEIRITATKCGRSKH